MTASKVEEKKTKSLSNDAQKLIKADAQMMALELLKKPEAQSAILKKETTF